MARVSLKMDDEINRRIEKSLTYGDSKSEWIREAIREKLEKEQSEPIKVA